MSWIKLLENPQGITGIFPDGPSLTGCDIMEVICHRDGPRVIVAFDLPDYPSAPPKRWRRDDANTVQLRLQLMDVSRVELTQWTGSNLADITLIRTQDGNVEFRAQNMSVGVLVVSRFLRLDRISAYHNALRAGR